MTEALPKFDQPPVVETVLGVQFEPIPGFRNAHLGAFWKSLDAGWSEVSDAPPLQPQHERFDVQAQPRTAGLHLSLLTDPVARVQIRRGKDRMVQVQNGRLLYNWIASESPASYPTFDAVKPEFEKIVKGFGLFLSAQQLPQFVPDQWEVTYVNHVVKGALWDSPLEWATRVVPALLTPLTSVASTRFESCGGDWSFEIPERLGRLHVEVRHGLLGPPKNDEVLVMKLTARGPIGGGGLDQGLNLGHRTIVRAFAEMTSTEAHRLWKRTQ